MLSDCIDQSKIFVIGKELIWYKCFPLLRNLYLPLCFQHEDFLTLR